MKEKIKLMLGDNMLSLKKLPDNCIDAIVTDPPYGLSFMGKKWDYDVPSVELWKECFRVLKPGGHVLSFGGTRTYHRMVVNMEDAGFEIRDQIMWLYGQGFPKSLNIGKAYDKKLGNKREVVGTKNDFALDGIIRKPEKHKPMKETINSEQEYGYKQGWDTPVTKGTSEYEGWGTALKPAVEPICLGRKPLSEKTVAENVIKWKTGGLNIDGCRIEFRDENDKDGAKPGTLNATGENSMFGLKSGNEQNELGRFPANVILDESAGEMLGSASRFFYCAKVSKKERNLGLDDKNTHPTIKPVELMRYLCRLITPKCGIILDPYMGSGSTGIAALLEDFRFCGMEMDGVYFKIAESRIEAYKKYDK